MLFCRGNNGTCIQYYYIIIIVYLGSWTYKNDVGGWCLYVFIITSHYITSACSSRHPAVQLLCSRHAYLHWANALWSHVKPSRTRSHDVMMLHQRYKTPIIFFLILSSLCYYCISMVKSYIIIIVTYGVYTLYAKVWWICAGRRHVAMRRCLRVLLRVHSAPVIQLYNKRRSKSNDAPSIWRDQFVVITIIHRRRFHIDIL